MRTHPKVGGFDVSEHESDLDPRAMSESRQR